MEGTYDEIYGWGRKSWPEVKGVQSYCVQFYRESVSECMTIIRRQLFQTRTIPAGLRCSFVRKNLSNPCFGYNFSDRFVLLHCNLSLIFLPPARYTTVHKAAHRGSKDHQAIWYAFGYQVILTRADEESRFWSSYRNLVLDKLKDFRAHLNALDSTKRSTWCKPAWLRITSPI